MANESESSESQAVCSCSVPDSHTTYSNSSSNIGNYTDESFESCSEDSEGSRRYCDESFEAHHYSEEEFEPETESETSATKSRDDHPRSSLNDYEGEEFESCDDSENLAAEEIFVEKRLGILQSQFSDCARCNGTQQRRAPRRETSQPPPAQSAALGSYCSAKINQLQRPSRTKLSGPTKQAQQHPSSPLAIASSPQQVCIVPRQLVNRVHRKCILDTVRQAMETDMHQPSKCPGCLAKKAELAEVNFLRVKKLQLEGAFLQEKLEEHLYLRDSLTLIGEILKDLPKPSDDTDVVWKRLIQRRQMR
uniref:Uncharacterized protein n=1 Tax=Callorhinchus milii TaxID=7868 RepID=A0A4W3IZ74_CALMI|eukprot:gi/632935900/ref/XP_007891694.1/ PREDICTED: uncharacterized protein C8orf48 homolog [Callorhinchus milii]